MFTATDLHGITDERHCDGKDHPNTLLAGVVYSCGFPDEHTYELVLKDKGKLVSITTNKF